MLIQTNQWTPDMMTGSPVVLASSQSELAFRLDAAEGIFFKRELEFIDQVDYEQMEAPNLSRLYIPTQPSVPDWAVEYTFRMYKHYGEAKIIGAAADDLPRADVEGAESTKNIKLMGAAYGWDFREIRAAAKTGRRLDAMKAMAARFSIEQLIDRILAKGLSSHGLDGLLNLSSVSTVTPSTKTGGGTSWSSATAKPDEIAGDMFAMAAAVVNGLQQAGSPAFYNLTILVPVDKHSILAQRRMGDGSNQTILQFVLQNSPYIKAIEPWYHCSGAGAGSTDRAVIYPRTPMVVAGLVPMEVQSMPPLQRNLEFVVNMVASCGGVVVRYPVAMRYMDGI